MPKNSQSDLLKPGFTSVFDNFASVALTVFIEGILYDEGNSKVFSLDSSRGLVAFTRFIWKMEGLYLYLTVPKRYEKEFVRYNSEKQEIKPLRLIIKLKSSKQVLKELEKKRKAASDASSHRQDFLMNVYPYSVYVIDNLKGIHSLSPQFYHRHIRQLEFVEKFINGLKNIDFSDAESGTIIEIPDSLKEELACIG